MHPQLVFFDACLSMLSQATPKDKKAALVIAAKVDRVSVAHLPNHHSTTPSLEVSLSASSSPENTRSQHTTGQVAD